MKRGTIRPINLSGRSKKIRMKKRTNVSVVSYFLDQNGSFVTMKANAKVQAGIISNALAWRSKTKIFLSWCLFVRIVGGHRTMRTRKVRNLKKDSSPIEMIALVWYDSKWTINQPKKSNAFWMWMLKENLTNMSWRFRLSSPSASQF